MGKTRKRHPAHYGSSMGVLDEFERPRPVGNLWFPESRGSLTAGVLLMIAGSIIVSRTAFGLSLEWLRHWWPLAPILFGAYLVFQSLSEKFKEDKKA